MFVLFYLFFIFMFNILFRGNVFNGQDILFLNIIYTNNVLGVYISACLISVAVN